MAATVPRLRRRAVLRLGALTLLGLPALARPRAPAAAQERPTSSPFDQARFLALARSSAEFQRRAAATASGRDPRPEVKGFATEMVRFREAQLARLNEVAGSGNAAGRVELEPEHRVVLENLEPLDFLALSRRYMEVQMQALEQEERGYEAALRDGQGAVRQFAETALPEIRQWREKAQGVWRAVAP